MGTGAMRADRIQFGLEFSQLGDACCHMGDVLVNERVDRRAVLPWLLDRVQQ